LDRVAREDVCLAKPPEMVGIGKLIYADPDNVGPIPLVTPGREGNFTWLRHGFGFCHREYPQDLVTLQRVGGWVERVYLGWRAK